jgi:hypothetical protein
MQDQEGAMSAPPFGQKVWLAIEAFARWSRNHIGSGQTLDLTLCEDREIERIATDVGLSPSELRNLARFGPDAADLLLSRMAALDVDRLEVARIEPQTFKDMQRVCTLCDSRRPCAADLARDPDDAAWQEYCPNVGTLLALSAVPWLARSRVR